LPQVALRAPHHEACVHAEQTQHLFDERARLRSVASTTAPHVRPVTLGFYQYLGAYVSNWSSVLPRPCWRRCPAVVLLLVAQRFVAADCRARSRV